MDTLRLGTIGTSQITTQFIEAALHSKHYSLEAVYSRSIEKAEDFKERYEANKAYADWSGFIEDPDIDVIYVASPNSLHFEQAMDALSYKKHLIIEKPMVTSLDEWDDLIEKAQKEECVVVEAARHLFEPNFIKVTEVIQDFPKVYGATLTYSKYSSRYDNVLAGEEPAIFSPTFAGGAANDLGIYVVYAAVKWFGIPDSVQAFSQRIETGVDGKGTAVLRYPSFDVTLHYGKINTSLNHSEVYSSDATLVLDAITGVSQANLVDARTRDVQTLPLEPVANNPLEDEAIAFAEVMKDPDSAASRAKVNEWQTLSRNVHVVLDEIRQRD
ncbi:Gfo/Idh/MocA family oxidoreductase [Alkalibacterium iburiense]|uniref:Gfo/Idh/MocA family oxidoreductase n=1 Tax=Alkalibacterium iburiense TaxID=290589 RepID=A0ABN0X4C0_9LACT